MQVNTTRKNITQVKNKKRSVQHARGLAL